MKKLDKPLALIMGCLAVGVVVTGTPSLAGEFAEKHPRRAEVLNRDNNLKNQTNRDEGHLGGHHGQLRHEEHAIKKQEQADAAAHGGHITRGEQHQINKEENHVEHQIQRDHH